MIYELTPEDDDVSEVDHAFVAGVLKGATSERLAILRLIGRLERECVILHAHAAIIRDAIRGGEHQVDP